MIEKPFGHDLDSARGAQRSRAARRCGEEQIYRIDHFLGKETVQNIMALRFANGIFEPIWNRDRIDHVQITVAETVGVEGRGSFYEATGALRDMVPNHLFQLLAHDRDGAAQSASTPMPSARGRPTCFAAMRRCQRDAGRCAAQYAAGHGAGQARQRLSGRAQRRARLERRDLCRDAA